MPRKQKNERLKTLQDLVVMQLPALDETYCEAGFLVSDRVFLAAIFIAQHCIVSVEGSDKDDFLQSDWFGAVFLSVQKWYRAQYGQEVFSPTSPSSSRAGLVLSRGMLHKLRVPLSIRRPSAAETSFEVYFPLELDAAEDPLHMLEPSIYLRAYRRDERVELIGRIAEIVGRLRRIWALLVPALGPDPSTHQIKNALFDHLEALAARAQSNTSAALGFAMMDLRMCCELTLKLHLLQEHGQFLAVHHFDKLLSKASEAVQLLYGTELPAELESYAKVNGLRYGERTATASTEFFDLYAKTLHFLERMLGLLKRQFNMNGMVCEMKQPAWARLGAGVLDC